VEDLGKMAARLDDLVAIANRIIDDEWYRDGWPKRQARIVCNRLEAAIDRIALPGTVYSDQLAHFRDKVLEEKFEDVYSIAVALRDDLKAGWIESITELVHADTFDNYLSMALQFLRPDTRMLPPSSRAHLLKSTSGPSALATEWQSSCPTVLRRRRIR
jgi:hypothetical protein